MSEGLITTFGAPNDLSVPVNSRFYPGGDNSIRGFQRGEAAPRNAAGEFVGAKVYVLANVEFEQALTSNWSVVAFGDALATAVSLRNISSAHERLYSVGLGIRYQTLIGPVRIEYGRNINPRPSDPPGTWHVSIGYPF
jgi:outer membrane translocation and assembly module TamA